MRAAGVTEFRIPDEWIESPEFGSILRYRDEMRQVTVFRLVTPGDVIDAEVIDAEVIDDPVLALPGGCGR